MGHALLFSAACVLLLFFLAYVFFVDHDEKISEDWKKALIQVGVSEDKLNDITHDDYVWSYKGISTCVCYGGEFQNQCDRSNCVCAGGKTFGNHITQATVIKEAIDSKNSHPQCPLFYYATS